MKKLVATLVAGAFALSLAFAAVAEEKKPAAPPAKEAAAKKEAAPKASKSRVITGMVEAVDAAAGTVTVKGRKEAVTLKAAEGVKLEDVKVGDKVTVTFRGDVLSKLLKSKGGKCCKEGKCKDCAKSPKDCKDCPACKDCKPSADCKDCPKGEKGAKGAKGAKGDKACASCPKAESAPKK